MENGYRQYQLFYLAGQEFGLEVRHVREAVRFKNDIIKLPTSVDIVEGVVNLRGAVIPLINLRTRLGLPAHVLTRDDHFAVIFYQGYCYGLLFDNISGVIRLNAAEINKVEAGDTDRHLCNSGILALDEGKRVIQVLDPEQLFKSYDLPKIENGIDEQRKRQMLIEQNISFTLDGQEYALDVGDIQEIIKVPHIERRVDLDDYIKGAINLRGELITVVDLRAYMGLPAGEVNADSRIIILCIDLPCGILVDAIREVIHYEIDKRIAVPAFDRGRFHDVFTQVIDLAPERQVILIDPHQLFSREAMSQITGNVNLHVQTEEAAKQYERKSERQEDDRTFITFLLEEVYAMDIRHMREIIEYPEHLVALPGSHAFSAGMLNLRGEAVPIIDLRQFYGMPPNTAAQHSRIMILQIGEQVFGVMVDNICEIVKAENMDRLNMSCLVGAQTMGEAHDHIKELLKRKGDDTQAVMVLDAVKLASSIRQREVVSPSMAIESQEQTALASNRKEMLVSI